MSEHDRCGVLVLARDEVSRRGLKDLLASVSSVKQVFTPVWDALTIDVVADLEIDVVVLSSGLRPPPNDECLDALRTMGPLIGIIGSLDPVSVSTALSWQANGYSTVEELTEELMSDLLANARRGESLISSGVAELLLKKSMSTVRAVRLTPREVDVVELLVEGLPNKSIARKLNISAHSTKRYVSNVLTKLHCSSRAQAVSRAFEIGLV